MQNEELPQSVNTEANRGIRRNISFLPVFVFIFIFIFWIFFGYGRGEDVGRRDVRMDNLQ